MFNLSKLQSNYKQSRSPTGLLSPLLLLVPLLLPEEMLRLLEPGCCCHTCPAGIPPGPAGIPPGPAGPRQLSPRASKRRARRSIRPLCWCLLVPALPCLRLLRCYFHTPWKAPSLCSHPSPQKNANQCNSPYRGARGNRAALNCFKRRANTKSSYRKVKITS